MQGRGIAFAVVCALVAGQVGIADAAPTLAEAQKLATDGETDQALAKLDEILVEKPNDPGAMQLRARLLLDARRWEEALDAYQAYLKIAPPGANKRAAEQIVVNLQPIKTTLLEVKVDPSDTTPAQVYLDSKTAGVFCEAAPTCTKHVLPGDHRLIIEREGYAKLSAPVSFKAGETLTFDQPLKEKPSQVTINSTPAGAKVVIDGKDSGVAPVKLELPSGVHQVELSLDRHTTAHTTVDARRGQPVTSENVLTVEYPLKGAPGGAKLILDGKVVTLERGAVLVPDDGQPHKLEVSSPGLQRRTIDLPAPGGDNIVDATLRQLDIQLSFAHVHAKGTLFIDGHEVGPLPRKEPWSGPAGKHTIEIQAEGGRHYVHEDDFAHDREVDVTVPAAPGRGKFWLATGAAAVFTGGAVVFGVLAMGKQSDYDARIKMAGVTADDSDLADFKDAGNRYALFSDISLGAAIVSAGAATWFLVRSGGDSNSLSVTFSPMSANVEGHF